jgi:hypothetical protein
MARKSPENLGEDNSQKTPEQAEASKQLKKIGEQELQGNDLYRGMKYEVEQRKRVAQEKEFFDKEIKKAIHALKEIAGEDPEIYEGFCEAFDVPTEDDRGGHRFHMRVDPDERIEAFRDAHGNITDKDERARFLHETFYNRVKEEDIPVFELVAAKIKYILAEHKAKDELVKNPGISDRAQKALKSLEDVQPIG